MCKTLIACTTVIFMLILILSSVTSLNAFKKHNNFIQNLNATNDRVTEANKRHEMSTVESVTTKIKITTATTALPDNINSKTTANTTNLPIALEIETTETTTKATTSTTAQEQPTLKPLQSNNIPTITSTLITTTPSPSSNYTSNTVPPPTLAPYCEPSLCEQFNGTHTLFLPHIACHNPGNFAPSCGTQPHLLHMSERRRNLILDLHNLARSRIAAGQVADYKPAAHMPQLKWDSELEYLATLHAKRCKFTHDKCRNTPRFPYSGQNIGYYWIRRDIKSHSRRMKNFIVNWFKEYLNANQTYIDSYHLHPEGKQIGHFTLLASDRVHRVGCAAIRYVDPDQPYETKFLLTCNYDYTNIWYEPIYQTGPTASKCVYKKSKRFPALCEWKTAVYEYEDTEQQILDDNNLLDNNILL